MGQTVSDCMEKSNSTAFSIILFPLIMIFSTFIESEIMISHKSFISPMSNVIFDTRVLFLNFTISTLDIILLIFEPCIYL